MATCITIRNCQMDECSAVLALWKEAEVIPSATDNIQVLKHLIQHGNSALLVAEDKKKLAGTVIAAWDGWRGNIYRLAVLPDYRRQGIARLLVLEAVSFLASKGAQRIGGLVAKEEPLAVSFWESLTGTGFISDSTFVRYTKSIEQ